MELPPLPDNAQKVLTLLSDPDVSVEKVRRLISGDGPIAAKILNIANYDFFGGQKTPPTLSDAIIRLGLNAVRNIVVAASLKELFNNLGHDEQSIWRRMIGSAIASSIIARHTKFGDPEDAFIGGLLHDAGEVAIINSFPKAYRSIVEMASDGRLTFAEACERKLGFNHREAGAVMVKRWGFPDAFESLIRNFDDHEALTKERYIYSLISIIALADRICDKLDIGRRETRGTDFSFGTLFETLGIDEQGMDRILENVKVAFSREFPLY